ncbi:MAG: glutathione S-transferase family protein [Gammaproteobacteria bacterium]
MRTLYQFEVSHYCEKARWALDVKGLDYQVKNLLPGAHRRSLARLAPRTSVPVLVDDGEVVQGSAEIITWLDRRHAQPALTPVGAEDRALALEWERNADRNVGVPLRAVFFAALLDDRALSTRLFTAHGPWWGLAWYALAFPAVRRGLRRDLNLNESNVAAARERLEQSFTAAEQRLAGRRYLAGPLFSRADLAWCALISPALFPPAALPAHLQAFIDAQRERPLFAWARDIYAAHRARR